MTKKVNIQYIYTAHRTPHRKKNKPILKMAKDLSRQFFKEHNNGQQAYEMMLNNANHQRNANIASILL